LFDGLKEGSGIVSVERVAAGQHLKVGLLAVDSADRHSGVLAVILSWLLAQETEPVLSPVGFPAL
jgi:hypothetical protein